MNLTHAWKRETCRTRAQRQRRRRTRRPASGCSGWLRSTLCSHLRCSLARRCTGAAWAWCASCCRGRRCAAAPCSLPTLPLLAPAMNGAQGASQKSCVMRVSALGMHVICCLHIRVQAHLLFTRIFQLLECGPLLEHWQVGAVLVRCRPGRLPFGSAAQWPGYSHALAIPATSQVSHAALVHVPALNWPQSSTVYRQYAGWPWERWQP